MKRGLMIAFAASLMVPAIGLAQSQQVLVTNNDSQRVPVKDVNFAGPWAASCTLDPFPSSVATGQCAITVPSNKIFVIEQVSTMGGVPTGQFVQFSLRAQTAGQGAPQGFTYALPSPKLYSTSTTDSFRGLHSTKIYADPGTTVTGLVFRTSTATAGPSTNFTFTFSGYLMNP